MAYGFPALPRRKRLDYVGQEFDDSGMGPSGGVEAPPQTLDAPEDDPAAQYEGFRNRYAGRVGKSALESLIDTQGKPQGDIRVAGRGFNEGSAYQRYQLPDGRLAHVYYFENEDTGKVERDVRVFGQPRAIGRQFPEDDAPLPAADPAELGGQRGPRRRRRPRPRPSGGGYGGNLGGGGE